MQYTENLHLNLPEDSDPLEVSKLSENFEKLDGAIKESVGESRYKVGDTLTTYRTDLGEDWLLCNGDSFDPEEYPELASITPEFETMLELIQIQRFTYSSAINNINSIAMHGDDGIIIWPAVTSSTSGTSMLYTTDGFKTLESMSVPPGLASSVRPALVYYCNGYWIGIWGPYGWRGVYATNELGPDATWVGTDSFGGPSIGSGSSAILNRPFRIDYYDGKYYMFMDGLSGSNYGSPKIAVADNPGFQDVEIRTVVHTNRVTAHTWTLVKTEHYYVYIGLDTKGNQITDILYSTTPEGPFIERQMEPQTHVPSSHSGPYMQGQFACPHGDIIIGNGYTNNWTEFGVKDAGVISFLDDIQNGQFQLFATTENYNRIKQYSLITFIRGKYYPISNNVLEVDIYKKTIRLVGDLATINGYVSSGSVTALYNLNYNEGRAFSYDMDLGKIRAFVTAPSTKTGNSYAYPGVITIMNYAVPKISQPQSYTYIKAKEDLTDANHQADTPAP